MACDLCGSRKGSLVKLLDEYQHPEIADLCSDCETLVNREKSRLVSAALAGVAPGLIEFMVRRRAELVGEVSRPTVERRSWWRRAVSRALGRARAQAKPAECPWQQKARQAKDEFYARPIDAARAEARPEGSA